MTTAKSPGEYGSRYVSFQDEFDEDIPSQTEQPEPGAAPTASDIELVGNGTVGGTRLPKRIRLRAVETEREYFLKIINIDLFRKLATVQAIASLIIVTSQVVLYAIVTKQSYKAVDYAGVGLWGPLVFFSTACWLTWMATKAPSGCCVGTAMGFQIMSIIAGIILLIFASISLVQHGQYSYWNRGSEGAEYDPEVTGRIFCSLMILAAVCVTVVAVISSIQFCKVTCCARANAHEAVLFDVEAVKVT